MIVLAFDEDFPEKSIQQANLRRHVHAGQKLYITAMDSLLRSAFVGAVQAQWILQPASRVVRQNLAIISWQDDWRNRGKALDLAKSWYGDSHGETLAADRQKLEASIAEAKALDRPCQRNSAHG
jgi:hypothetical protein